jgi:hypothetical protein
VSRRAVRPFRARLERPEVTKTGEFSNVISGENCSATHSLEGIVSKRASSLYLQRGQSALQRLTDKPSLLIGYSIERLDGLRRRAAPSLNLRHGR